MPEWYTRHENENFWKYSHRLFLRQAEFIVGLFTSLCAYVHNVRKRKGLIVLNINLINWQNFWYTHGLPRKFSTVDFEGNLWHCIHTCSMKNALSRALETILLLMTPPSTPTPSPTTSHDRGDIVMFLVCRHVRLCPSVCLSFCLNACPRPWTVPLTFDLSTLYCWYLVCLIRC